MVDISELIWFINQQTSLGGHHIVIAMTIKPINLKRRAREPRRTFVKWRQGAHTYRLSGLSHLVMGKDVALWWFGELPSGYVKIAMENNHRNS